MTKTILNRCVAATISDRLLADGQNYFCPMLFTISSGYLNDIGPMMVKYRFADWKLLGFQIKLLFMGFCFDNFSKYAIYHILDHN